MMVVKYENNQIYYIDEFKRLDKYCPTISLKWKNVKILPANYWTMSLLVKYCSDLNFLNDYEKLKKSIATMNYLKCNSLDKEAMSTRLNELKGYLPERINWLYDYQKIDAFLGYKRKCFGNFNTMRSGKTPTTIASLYLRYVNNDPTKKVIISILQATSLAWKETIYKIAHEYKVFDLSGSIGPKERKVIWNEWLNYDGYCIMLINKDKLANDISKKDTCLISMNDIKKTHFGIITDECHFLRNVRTKQSEIHFFLSKHANYRMGLTGTKIANSGEDLYGVLKYLQPHKINNKELFLSRYFVAEVKTINRSVKYNVYTNYNEHTKPELMGLISSISVERKESEVLSYLPGYETEVISVEPTKPQLKAYQKLINDWEIDLANDEFMTLNSGAALRLKLLQLQSWPDSILKDNQIGAKAQWLVDFLHKNTINNKLQVKPIVFGRFTNIVLEPLERYLEGLGYKVGSLTGLSKDKSIIADKWQKGEYDILLCNIKAGGTGLTLDYADHAIFFEREEGWADNTQAEKRITATKKDDLRIKKIYHLVMANIASVDLIQYARQNEKLQWVEEMYPDKMTKHLIEFEKRLRGE